MNATQVVEPERCGVCEGTRGLKTCLMCGMRVCRLCQARHVEEHDNRMMGL